MTQYRYTVEGGKSYRTLPSAMRAARKSRSKYGVLIYRRCLTSDKKCLMNRGSRVVAKCYRGKCTKISERL